MFTNHICSKHMPKCIQSKMFLHDSPGKNSSQLSEIFQPCLMDGIEFCVMDGSQKRQLHFVHLCFSWILFSLSFLKTPFGDLDGFRSVVIGEGTSCYSTVSCHLSSWPRPVVLTAFLLSLQKTLRVPFSIKTPAWRTKSGYWLHGYSNFMIAWGNWWPAGEEDKSTLCPPAFQVKGLLIIN